MSLTILTNVILYTTVFQTLQYYIDFNRFKSLLPMVFCPKFSPITKLIKVEERCKGLGTTQHRRREQK